MTRVVLLAVLAAVSACDPAWGVQAKLRDPGDRPVEDATVAIACSGETGRSLSGMVQRSSANGEVSLISIGAWPAGCDLFVAKPGYQTRRMRYADLCPEGPRRCDRVFRFDLVLEPE